MYSSIDRLRGLFAISVMLGHTIDFAAEYAARIHASDIGQNIIGPLRGFLGFVWVRGFIAVSGFCIAKSTHEKTPFSPVAYVASRASRLFPMLWACLLLALASEALAYVLDGRADVWHAGLTFHNFIAVALGIGGFYGTYGATAPSYTISYEILYYALWGCAWSLLLKPGWALALSLVAGLVLVPFRDFQFPAMLFAVWLMGAAVYFSRNRLAILLKRVPTMLAWLALFVLMGTIAVLQGTWQPYLDLTATPISSAEFLSIGLAFGFLLAVAIAKSPNPDDAAFNRRLGEISYPLYLVHGPVLVAVFAIAASVSLHLSFSAFVAIGCTLALAAAYGLVILIERPLMRWRATLRGRNTPIVDAAPAIVAQHLGS